MSSTTWFRTITQPITHLVSTIAYLLAVVVGVFVASIYPEWRLLIIGIVLVCAVAWYVVMMRAYNRGRKADAAAAVNGQSVHDGPARQPGPSV